MVENDKKSDFICGVVEGFYGRPWTSEQRKDLFQKLKHWGMDSYLYAPKDDYKHRAYWRELYTVEEAEHLTALIASAKDNDITFYYALSPGLDITYSSPKEVAALKRKLEQVSQFGCIAFALLFDDIEPEMSEVDKEVFQSFAHAQVTITNDIYEYMNHPKFMICPTQYCSTRAHPNVRNSEYLNTLGSKLASKVDIMWTGGRVISRVISSESIDEITEVLHRPPVIWDNIHANDYDQKRIFLGPYLGRSPEIIRKLRGVMTNPNCEYGANFVAIHTLAQWRKCTTDCATDLSSNESISADIKLETEADVGMMECGPVTLPSHVYHPRRALRNAISDWLLEFKKHKQAWGPIAKPQTSISLPTSIPLPVPIIPSINTCMSITTTTSTTTTCSTTCSNNSDNLSAASNEICSTVACNASLMQPCSSVSIIMNSLASDSKVISEPMDCNSTPGDSPSPSNAKNDIPMDNSMAVSQEDLSNMVVDTEQQENGIEQKDSDKELQFEDLVLLCDLFYLPFEHGAQGVQILQEFNWLKSNAHVVASSNLRKRTRSSLGEDSPEVQEWRERAKKFGELYRKVDRLHERLTYCNNRELLYDLYPYIWDMRGVISLLNSYITWLGFSKGWKESFMSGEQEPWVFRGGLTADLQRLIPVDSGVDLFTYKPPETPSSNVYTVRPYMANDEEDERSVYNVCRETCLDGGDGTEMFSKYPNLPPERMVGGFLTFSPEFCFVVEDDTGVVGYAAAALDSKQFHMKMKNVWIPKMCEKYPNDEDGIITEEEISLPQEMIRWFHKYKMDSYLESNAKQYPSVMCAAVVQRVSDQSVVKKLIICLLAALRANGSFGAYAPVKASDVHSIEFYKKLGFAEICVGSCEEKIAYMGRIF